ncbi:hypothetical protein [Paenibacillus piscarius]|uniref:hypothetical protein n=1 Tax=Paenibacillus piscarius TaxID=1089681 RepID=UPI001EE95E70|nr:hypothetical protein [Paenibacillus piscarius]
MKNQRACAALVLGMIIASTHLALSASAAPSSVTANKTQQQNTSTLAQLPPVTVQAGVSVRLTDVQLAKADGGNSLTYTLVYSNTSSSTYKLFNVFSKITTPAGASLKSSPIPEDKSKAEVAPKEQLTVTYYVNAGKLASPQGLSISLFGFDFSGSEYQKKLGSFTVPAAYTPYVQQGLSKQITVSNLPVTLKPESLQIYSFNNKTYAKVALSVTNLGPKVLAAPGHRVFLESSGGSAFELTLDSASRDYKVQSGENKKVLYLAELPAYIPTTRMSLLITGENAGLKADLPVVSFRLPEAAYPSLDVNAYAIRKFGVSSNTIETQLKQASVSSTGEKALWTLKLRVKNAGNKAVTLPAYELSVTAKEGYSFPVNSKTLASLTLKPLEEKILQFSAEVPLKVNQSTLKLQMVEPAAEGKLIFPAALYKIPYALEMTNSIASEVIMDNSFGTFGVTLESLQRMPWTTEDLLVAAIRIRNVREAAVTLPAFTGEIKAGQAAIDPAVQVVADSPSRQLPAGASTVYYVIGKLPYEQSVDQLRIGLSSTTGDTAEPFLSLNTRQAAAGLAAEDAAAAFRMETPGKRAEVKERRTVLYPGTSQNIVYTELEVNSLEARTAELSRFVAYYKTPDRTYYEAEVSQSTLAAAPKGKSLVTVWSRLPAGTDASQLTLFIGEGVSEGKLTAPAGTPAAYIHPKALGVHPQTPAALTTLGTGVPLFPYTFTVTQATGAVSEGQDTLNVNLTYTLAKDNQYDMGAYAHKLVVQLTDPLGQTQEKTLLPGTDLVTGRFLSYPFTLTSNAYKTLRSGKFQVTLYDEFQGERILLGSQSYSLTYTPAAKAPEAAVPSNTTNPDGGGSR